MDGDESRESPESSGPTGGHSVSTKEGSRSKCTNAKSGGRSTGSPRNRSLAITDGQSRSCRGNTESRDRDRACEPLRSHSDHGRTALSRRTIGSLRSRWTPERHNGWTSCEGEIHKRERVRNSLH